MEICGDDSRDIEIPKSSPEQVLFGHVRVCGTQGTGDENDGFDGAKTPVVVQLLGQKPLASVVQGCELRREDPRRMETFGHEKYFAAALEIWRGRTHGSETRLHAFGQFGATDPIGVSAEDSATARSQGSIAACVCGLFQRRTSSMDEDLGLIHEKQMK
jgi:hypothetical protein